MKRDTTRHPAGAVPPPTTGSDWAHEGWIGTLEQPGYRAGPVVAKLDEFKELARDHLYLDLLLLDAGGRVIDNDSGPCPAVPRQRPVEDRSRHVRLVAELVRHAPDTSTGLASFGPALSFIREYGVDVPILSVAAQLLDAACSERAVTLSLHHMLVLSLGEEDSGATVERLVAQLATAPLAAAQVPAVPCGSPALAPLTCLVRSVGKDRVRRFVRDAIDFPLVPTPDMFGV